MVRKTATKPAKGRLSPSNNRERMVDFGLPS
jgi:hypothetical protein